jgi:hypothetical protein
MLYRYVTAAIAKLRLLYPFSQRLLVIFGHSSL